MWLRPVPDPGVLKEADAFLKAGQILDTFKEPMMVVPAIVNAAFALELYLKSLNMKWLPRDADAAVEGISWITSRTASKKGHAPSRLYSALSRDMRDTLEQRYSNYCGANSPPLNETLMVYDGLFEDWRYAFEGRCKSVNLSALFSLLGFLSKVINDLPQQWHSEPSPTDDAAS